MRSKTKEFLNGDGTVLHSLHKSPCDKFLCNCIQHTHIQVHIKHMYMRMCVKTGEIQIRSTPEFMVLHQSQFPGFDKVFWLYTVLSLG